MTDTALPSSSRKHLAKRGYGRDGLTIRCTCGAYEPIAGTTREQEDAHRAHRTAMGETVKPRALTKVERLEAEIERLRAENKALAADAEVTRAARRDQGVALLHQVMFEAAGNGAAANGEDAR